MENNKVKLIIDKGDAAIPVKVILMPYAAFADPENPTSAEAADWMIANVGEEDWTGSLVIYRTPTEDTYMHEIDYNWVWEVSKTDDGFINIITIEKRNNNFPKTAIFRYYIDLSDVEHVEEIYNNTGRTVSNPSYGQIRLSGDYALFTLSTTSISEQSIGTTPYLFLASKESYNYIAAIAIGDVYEEPEFAPLIKIEIYE